MGYLEQVERLLNLPPAAKRQILAELRSHYAEAREDALAAGAGDPDVEAARRLGDPKEVARHLNAVHCQATWRDALLAAAPAVIVLGTAPARAWASWPAYVWIGVVTTLLLGAGALLGLRHGRRPVWTATWLGVACYQPIWILADAFTVEAPFGRFHPLVRLAVPLLLLLLGSRSSLWWRRASIGLVASLVALLAIPHPYPPGIVGAILNDIGLLACLGALVALALRFFAASEWALPGEASLFLYAGLLLAPQEIPVNGTDPHLLLWALVHALLVGSAVVLHARAHTGATRYAALAGAALLYPVVFRQTLGGDYGLVLLLLCLPALFERWVRPRPAAVAP